MSVNEYSAVLEAEMEKQRDRIDATLGTHLANLKDLIRELMTELREHSNRQTHEQVEQLQRQITMGISPRERSGSVLVDFDAATKTMGSRHTTSGFSLNERWHFAAEAVDALGSTDELGGDEDDANSSGGSVQPVDTGMHRRRCMIRPSSVKRLVWDMLSILFIFFDLVSIPVFLAFEATDTDFTNFMFYLVLSFWTTDMVLSFFTGIYVKGVEEMRRRRVAVSYLKTWFAVDMVVVGVDWLAVVLSNRQSGVALMRMGKTLRTLRILRTLRLLRLIKVRHLLEQLQDHISSEVFQILVKMAKLMVFVLMMNHFLACFWFWIGDNSGGPYGNWVTSGGFDSRSLTYKYFTSLHWSLTQFTTGSMEVTATNETERVFSVVTLVFALMIFSSFLSSITAAMTQLQHLSSEAPQKMSQLRRYMKSRPIPRGLKVRIFRYVDHKLAADKHQVQEREVDLLHILSEPLTRELKLHINQPFLVKHPFFTHFVKRDRDALQHVCNLALTLIPLSKGDSLFAQRVSDSQMFFCMSGTLEYTHSKLPRNQTRSRRLNGSSRVHAVIDEEEEEDDDENVLNTKDWCCEPALWTTWVHVGSMHAKSVSDVLALSANPFADVIKGHQTLASHVLQYARGFIEQLNMMIMSGSQPSDLALISQYGIRSLADDALGKKEEYQTPPPTSQGVRGALKRAQSKDFGRLRRGQTRNIASLLGLDTRPSATRSGDSDSGAGKTLSARSEASRGDGIDSYTFVVSQSRASNPSMEGTSEVSGARSSQSINTGSAVDSVASQPGRRSALSRPRVLEDVENGNTELQSDRTDDSQTKAAIVLNVLDI